MHIPTCLRLAAFLLGVMELGLASRADLPPVLDVTQPRIERFKENPLIRPEMLPGSDGTNICGPSLIRVPAWVPNPLGKYYLYFADHGGKYIRLAYADRLEGPWKIHEPGTLQLEQMVEIARQAEGDKAAEVKGGHVASPDVHVDEARQEIRMYFHFQIAPAARWGHRSNVATSKDGLHFQPVNARPIGEPYFRVFQWDGYYYAINRSAALARSRDGLRNFEVGNRAFAEAVGNKVLAAVPYDSAAAAQAATTAKATRDKKGSGEDADEGIRHTAIQIDGNLMTVYYSRIGDVPERILASQVTLTGDWQQWRLSPPRPVLAPEADYEGAREPLRAAANSEMRTLPRPLFHELRDPCIFRENGITYLFYTIAGERGIAGAVLRGE